MNGILGLAVVIVSLFTLPFHFIRRSWAELSEVGERRAVTADEAQDVPLLNWLLVAGRMAIAGAAVLFYLLLVISTAFTNGAGAMIVAILFGWLPAALGVWVGGTWLELLSLQIVLVRNTRQILDEVVEARRSVA